MVESRIVIYSKRFLIVKGLECFIQDNFGEQPISFFVESEMLRFLNNLDKALIIWDNDLFTKDSVAKINNKNFFILALGRVSPPLRAYIQDFIPLKAEANYVLSLLKNYINKTKSSHATEPVNRTGLTEREREIVRLVALGKTNQQIAEELSISPYTATTHRKNIAAKLGIKTISGLTIYAILNGLVTMEEIEKSIK